MKTIRETKPKKSVKKEINLKLIKAMLDETAWTYFNLYGYEPIAKIFKTDLTLINERKNNRLIFRIDLSK